jgi:hypothetical protein
MVFGLGVFMIFGLSASRDQGWALIFRDLIFSNGRIIIGVLGAAISSLFAYTMGLKRLYVYGILTLALLITGHFIAVPFYYLLLTIGVVITVAGFVLLVRFIQKYPLTR